MSEHDDLIARLTDLAGMAPGFRDQHGTWIETPLSARRDVLEGFGLKSGTVEDVRASIAVLESLRLAALPPLIVALVDAPTSLRCGFGGDGADWVLTNEAGEVREGRAPLADGHVLLPPLGMGYYELKLRSGDVMAVSTIISAPARCYEPDCIARGEKLWGAVAQVYGLRSSRNFGIGEYSDIGDAASGAGVLGGDFLGLSPLHVLFAVDRSKYSPYSPSSRLFLESLYIDISAIPGFFGSRASALAADPDFRRKIAALREAPLVDYKAVWDVKRPLLNLLFEDFVARGIPAEFRQFRKDCGEPLELHATFEALSEHFMAEGRTWPGEWPAEFRSPKSDVVGWFREEKAERVTFHAWLQWLADTQLAQAASQAEKSGLRIGLYRDLAVGGDRGGSEVWAAPDLFSKTLSVGAPPDPLGPQGQNWGLPPLDPFALERHGLKAFRALVAANMRHAGAIRIDHAFQLRRLYLIPEGKSGPDGAYMHYPFDALLASLRLESHRAKCLVIAEDLGTAPEGFSNAIMEAGLLSYRVMYFERGEHGRFKRPGEYPREAMSVFTTHDLPTLRGWWRGLDIDLREKLHVFDPARAENERAGRRHDVQKFCEALREEGLSDGSVPPEPPLDAAVRFIARAPSALTAIQFEDAGNESDQANVPGIEEGYPNWRRRLSQTVDELTKSGGQLARWAALMRGEGRGRA